MITLAFDTTAKIASVAVLDGERVLANYSIDNGLTQSELILPMAESMLSSLKLTFGDVGLIATAVGPGSFTGVRIGVALAKGLAFGRNIPVCEVSTLEALAENVGTLRGILVPAMDARRSQVYNAIFRSNGETIERLTEDRAISLSELCCELKAYEGERIYVSGDGYGVTVNALRSANVSFENTPELLIAESAVSVGRVAQRMYERGETVSDKELKPTYLRLPQAERERLEKEKAERKN
jgi:tRNA threonylcarbamoyladenosine biosynthesis protein TsaB